MRDKLLTVICIACTTLLCACGQKENTEPEIPSIDIEEQAIEIQNFDEYSCIENIIYAKINGRVADLYDELSKIKAYDATKGEKWQEICDYWDEINESSFVNVGIVPEGLPEDDSLCIIVMGYQLMPDGTMRDELIGRLETALNVANEYQNAYILVTGGGTASEAPEATEADSMAEWLYENGISEDRVIIENKSLTSTENAVYSNRILRDDYPNIKSAMVVTSDYHVPLGCILYNSQFILAGDEGYKIRVISNSAFATNTKYFTKKTQGDCILQLYRYQE